MKHQIKDSVFPRDVANSLSKVCELVVLAQHEMNKTVRPDWPAANFPFLRAARAEISEAQGYTSWEWWKNLSTNYRDVFRTQSDQDEFHMELVDALHFMVSAHIQTYWNGDGHWGYWDLVNAGQGLFKMLDEGQGRSLSGDYRLAFTEDATGALPPESTLVRLEQLQHLLLADDLRDAFYMLVELANHTGLGLEGLLGRYFAKNTLNVFRAAHGYKEKTYVKSWGDGKEDNFYLNRQTIPYLSQVTLGQLIDEVSRGEWQSRVYNELAAMYSRVTRNGHCDHEAAEASGPAHGNPSGHE